MWPGWLVPGALPLSSHPLRSRCRLSRAGTRLPPGGKLPLGQHSASLSGPPALSSLPPLTSPHSSLAFPTQGCYSVLCFSSQSFLHRLPLPLLPFSVVFCCCVTSRPRLGGLKQHICIILGFWWVSLAEDGFAGGSGSESVTGCRCGCALSHPQVR